MNNQLKWNITGAEKREQIQKLIIFIGPISFLLFLSTLLKQKNLNLEQVIFVPLSIILCFVVLLIVNKFFPHKEKTYVLEEDSLTISKGKKVKRYLWNDFECFHIYRVSMYEPDKIDKSSRFETYRSEVGGERKKMLETLKTIQGNIFYLKKKSKHIFAKLYKSFVVIYSEVDNSKAVLNFLNAHLSQKKMSVKDELGLVFYEFK